MDSNNVLQNEVSDVYQKTLMSIPRGITSFRDVVTNKDFINSFIMFFDGSRLDNVRMDVDDDRCRQKVIALFSEIQRDLHNARNSDVELEGLSSDLNILRMYIDGRKDYDDTVKNALYSAQNMSMDDPEAAALFKQADEKRKAIRAYMKGTGGTYEYTREGIRNYFSNKGVIEEVTDKHGRETDNIVKQAMLERPSEVEELVHALTRLVESAYKATDKDVCLWVADVSMSGLRFGREYLAEQLGTTPDQVNAMLGSFSGSEHQDDDPNYPIISATAACRRLAVLTKGKVTYLNKNVTEEKESGVMVLADPYMKLISNMIQSGKVSKEPDGPIIIVDATKIVPNDITSLCSKVTTSLFNLGPIDDGKEDTAVQFKPNFSVSIDKLKTYIDFLTSNELKPVVDATIQKECMKLAEAYILTKAVYNTFNDGIMSYSDSDTTYEEKNLPSINTFCKEIGKICGEYSKLGIEPTDIFDAKIMFRSDIPYFPIEEIISQNVNLYDRMRQYSTGANDAAVAKAKKRVADRNLPVQDVSKEFSSKFNQMMKGAASLDEYCENLKMSTMITSRQFAVAFNMACIGITYADGAEVNDKDTESNLWSVLKTLANNTPSELGEDVKKEFMNVAYTQENLMYRLNLAVNAGVVTTKKGYHFSGNLGTIENGVNKQAGLINSVMKIFLVYSRGLRYKKATVALQKKGFTVPMSTDVVKPYVTLVYNIAKEYEDAFAKNNGEALGCSVEWSHKIIEEFENLYKRG